MPNGKPKRKVIAKHSIYTLEQARTLAKQLLMDIDSGIAHRLTIGSYNKAFNERYYRK